MKEPQAYLSRVEVAVFGHLLQLEHGLDPRLPDNCKVTAPLSVLFHTCDIFLLVSVNLSYQLTLVDHQCT